MKKIVFFTSSRSDFGIQLPLIRKFLKSKKFKTYTLVTGSHFSKKYGNSYQEVLKSGIKNKKLIKINYKVDKPKNVSFFLSKLLIKISKLFEKIKPNYLILLGDRFEILIPIMIANHFKIPTIHLHGGEITVGSMDELTRHAVSKMSQIHFPCTENYKKRLIQLGENSNNIHNFGSISLSDIKNMNLIDKKEILKKFNLSHKNNNLIVTFHPEITFDKKTTYKKFKIICNSLSEFKNFNVIFTAPAQELNSEIIIKLIKDYCKKHQNAKFIKSIGRKTYLSCLKNFDLMLGNSSSGIIEAPYFNIPVINIGDRQLGRDFSLNIVNCEYNKREIINKIHYTQSKKFKNNLKKNKAVYYKINTVDKIYKKISKLNFKQGLLKKFIDI